MDVKRTDLHPRPIFCDLEKFCCAQVQGIASCLHAAGTEDQLATIQWCASNSEKASFAFFPLQPSQGRHRCHSPPPLRQNIFMTIVQFQRM